MCIKQAQAQMHQDRALTRAHVLNEARTGLISYHSICTINLFGVDACTFSPLDERSTPLGRGRGGNGPPIVLNHHQYGQLVYRCLAKQRVEIVGRHPTVAYSEHDDVLALVPLQGKADTACEGTYLAHLTKMGQDQVAFAAVVGGHVATGAHWP